MPSPRTALRRCADEGYARDQIELLFAADLRHAGQSSELPVALEDGAFDDAARARLMAGFERAYQSTYGYAASEPLELVNLRLAARGNGARLDFAIRARAGGDRPRVRVAVRASRGATAPSRRPCCRARRQRPASSPAPLIMQSSTPPSSCRPAPARTPMLSAT